MIYDTKAPQFRKFLAKTHKPYQGDQEMKKAISQMLSGLKMTTSAPLPTSA